MKKTLISVIFLLTCITFTSLWANLPCEDGCENKCDCDESGGNEGGGADDASAGNKGATGGSGGNNVSSISIWINWGSPANENIKGKYQFSIYTKKPTPMIYSPQIIQYQNLLLDRINIVEINQQYKQEVRGDKYASVTNDTEDEKVVDIISDGFGQEKLLTSLPSNVTHQVKIFTSRREMMTFQFKTGMSIGQMVGDTSTINNTLRMVNSVGEPTTTNPQYYDRYLGQGNFLRYSAQTGKVVSYHSAMGRVVVPEAITVGVEPIYDADGTIRQVWSLGDGLADIVVTQPAVSYEIRCYSPEQVGTKENGLYTSIGIPHTVWRIENPNPGTNTKVQVTKISNGLSEVSLYEYSHNSEAWLLNKPDNLGIESQTTSWDYSQTVKVITTVKKTPDGKIASKIASTYQKFPFGDRIVNVSVDPDGVNLRTQRTYHTDSNNPGSLGRKKSETFSNGSWASFQYDSQGREIIKITLWKNSRVNSSAAEAQAEYRSFIPNDARDIVENDDMRPRVEETKILGITTSKTYHAYYFDNSEYVEIEEHCTNVTAQYGDSSNLRTERRYYPRGNNSSPSAGRIHTIKYPDRTMDTFTYEYGTWILDSSLSRGYFMPGNGSAIRLVITHGTIEAPQGIAHKTTQDIIVYDSRGCRVYTAKNVYTGDGYELLSWISNTFDEQRRLISVLNSNNESTEYTWNCCSKASEKLPDGTQVAFVYDVLKRLVAKTVIGSENRPDIIFTYAYDAANRKISETITSGNLDSTATWEYNLAGQLVKKIDHQGLITTFNYIPGTNSGNLPKGQSVITVNPGGATNIETRYCSGQIESQTGTAVIAEYYDYGVENSGYTWAKKNVAGKDSPRWEKIYYNLLGNQFKIG